MDSAEDELFGHLFPSATFSATTTAAAAAAAAATGGESTAFRTLSTKSGPKGPIVGQVIRCRCSKVGVKRTTLFTAWLLDLSSDSEYRKLGDRRVGNRSVDEIEFQAWSSDAEDYNRSVKVGDVIEVQNYVVKDAYRASANGHRCQLSHSSYRGNYTTYNVAPPGVSALSTAAALERLYVSPVSVGHFKEWEVQEGPEKWNTYTVLGVATYASELYPPKEGSKNMTRRLTIIDADSYSINVMLIGAVAERFACRAGDIVMLYNFQMGDTWGRSLRCFNLDGMAAIFDAYTGDIESDGGTDDLLRRHCIAPEVNPFCRLDVERLKKWRAVYWGTSSSMTTHLSNMSFDDESYRFEPRTLHEVETIEVDQLSERNSGPIRHVIIGSFADLRYRNGLYNIVCTENRCSYRVSWVGVLGKWVCSNPRVDDTPRIPGLSEENRALYRWTGHAIASPGIRFSLQAHIRDENNDQRFVFLGDNPMKTILGGVTAEQWATGTMALQEQWRQERLADLSEKLWKIHAMSSYNKNAKTPFQMRVVSIEPFTSDDLPLSPPPYGGGGESIQPRKRVLKIKRKNREEEGGGRRKRVRYDE